MLNNMLRISFSTGFYKLCGNPSPAAPNRIYSPLCPYTFFVPVCTIILSYTIAYHLLSQTVVVDALGTQFSFQPAYSSPTCCEY